MSTGGNRQRKQHEREGASQGGNLELPPEAQMLIEQRALYYATGALPIPNPPLYSAAAKGAPRQSHPWQHPAGDQEPPKGHNWRTRRTCAKGPRGYGCPGSPEKGFEFRERVSHRPLLCWGLGTKTPDRLWQSAFTKELAQRLYGGRTEGPPKEGVYPSLPSHGRGFFRERNQGSQA